MIDPNKVYDILVEECNARDDWREMFVHIWPDCREFRFQGNQGFGGKVWAPGTMKRDVAYITIYREDENWTDNAARERANRRLEELYAGA